MVHNVLVLILQPCAMEISFFFFFFLQNFLPFLLLIKREERLPVRKVFMVGL